MSPETLKPCPFCGGAVELLGGPQAQEPYSAWCNKPGCVGRGRDLSIDREASIRAWNTRAATPAGPSGWMPIESAPKDGSGVLATGWNHGKPDTERHYAVAFWDGLDWLEAHEDEASSPLGYLTHWMPLPPAPTDKEA